MGGVIRDAAHCRRGDGAVAPTQPPSNRWAVIVFGCEVGAGRRKEVISEPL